MKILDAKDIYYRELNVSVRKLLESGETEITLKNVLGQRYIGCGLKGNQRIIIEGVPGNDMAAFMDGLELVVNSNAQDAIANTMNSGRVVVHGNAGDTVGYGMRGGEIFIRGNVGYRVGIHMKEYEDKKPVLVVGGKAGDFLGEYMAGGIIILLGLNIGEDEDIIGNFCGTGLHGGIIYVRGDIKPYMLGKEVGAYDADEKDMSIIGDYIKRFSQYFGFDYSDIMKGSFKRIHAYNKRPYGNLYA